MQNYQSHKIVEAGKIKAVEKSGESDVACLVLEDDSTIQVGTHWLAKHEPEAGWYYVLYPDGYQSASPPDAFEDGYKLVQPSSGKSKIAGYRELTAEEIGNMNAIKEHGKRLGELVESMRKIKSLDQRWVSTGATDLQKGLMALTRAVARPEFF